MSLSNPFAAFLMSEFHGSITEGIVRREELEAVPGQVECGGPHARVVQYDDANVAFAALAFDVLPCPTCGAAV